MKHLKITNNDFVKAIKKADREIQLTICPGFKSNTKIHSSEKMYNRKKLKKVEKDLFI